MTTLEWWSPMSTDSGKKIKVKLNCKHGGEWFVAENDDESATHCEKCGKEVPATIIPLDEGGEEE